MASLASQIDRTLRRRRKAGPEPEDAPPGDGLLQGLEMICRLLERPFSQADIRAAAPTPPEGLTPGQLLLAAERLGFKAREVRTTARRLGKLPTPFLLLGEHPGQGWLVRRRAKDLLVVVEPVSGQAAALDPATVADMAPRAMLLKALPEPEKAPAWREEILRRLRPVLWEVGLASVVINLLALATPIFLMTVYNKVINHGALETLDVLALGMLTLFTFEWLLRSVRGYIASHSGGRLDAALGAEVVHHIVHLPLRTFDTVPTGQILERTRQLDTLRLFFTSQMPLLLVDLVFVAFFLAILFYLDARLGWIVFAAMPLFWLLSFATRRRQRDLLEKGFKAASAKATSLGETIGNALTVKALRLEPEIERRFREQLAEHAWAGFQASHLGGLVGSTGQALQHLVTLLIVYVGARAIVAGEMSIGALVAATILAARALAPMRLVVGAFQQVQGARDALRRLDELMREPTELRRAPMPSVRLTGRIRFDQITHRYGKEGPPALNAVDFELAPGQVLAVTGPPGSGKSTLARLILGLDRPAAGRVLIDDLDVRLLSAGELRQQIGVVPQEVQLFAGTLSENIALGADDRSFERVVAAAKFVGAHEFIQRLPEGYDTRLGERGSGLSAGQRQLITIARAVIRNPRILLLDEATSALDLASESMLLASLKRASRGRTIILVAHRPAVLGFADLVLHLDEGRIDYFGPARAYATRNQPAPAAWPHRSHLAPV